MRLFPCQFTERRTLLDGPGANRTPSDVHDVSYRQCRGRGAVAPVEISGSLWTGHRPGEQQPRAVGPRGGARGGSELRVLAPLLGSDAGLYVGAAPRTPAGLGLELSSSLPGMCTDPGGLWLRDGSGLSGHVVGRPANRCRAASLLRWLCRSFRAPFRGSRPDECPPSGRPADLNWLDRPRRRRVRGWVRRVGWLIFVGLLYWLFYESLPPSRLWSLPSPAGREEAASWR